MKRNIKDLFIDAKDAAELMVDLAFAAITYDDREIAREVIDLEANLEVAVFEIRKLCLLAARSPDDAEYFVSILQVVTAMEAIGDAAEDIARVVLKRMGVPRDLREDLRHADQVVGRIPLGEDSVFSGRSLRELAIPRHTGLWVIAIKRDVEWIFDPDADQVIHDSDVLYVQGSEDGVLGLRVMLGAPANDIEPTMWEPSGDLETAVDLIVELKNLTEVAVGLAYSALILNDKGLAAEVVSLEDRTDEMKEELEGWVLAAGRSEMDPVDLRALLHIGEAVERIADAAQEMVWLVEHDEELHPIVAEALAETDEIVVQFVVEPGSFLAGKTLGETQLRTETGMHVLAVQRGVRWRYRPRKQFALEPGDRIVAQGPEDGAEILAELSSDRG